MYQVQATIVSAHATLAYFYECCRLEPELVIRILNVAKHVATKLCDAGFEAIDASLSVITSTSCPRFHADHVQLRCLCTYIGEGTYFVPNKAVNRHNWIRALGICDTNGFGVKSATSVQQATEWDVVILKGEAFPGNQGKNK